MTFKLHVTALALLCALTAHAAPADDATVGYVKTTQGDATLVREGKTVKAEPGLAVQQATVLKTGKNASLGLTLKDNTLLSIGPDTELALDEFLFAPAQDQFKLDARLVKGSLNYVSGIIAKLKPQAINVRTPTGNIGVRGTHFVAAVEGE
jgi:hypothetical protein